LGIAKLSKFFQPPGELRKEEEPATVLDFQSRIVAWSLPDVLCDYTVVCRNINYIVHVLTQ
jgi:hypothetical protein